MRTRSTSYVSRQANGIERGVERSEGRRPHGGLQDPRALRSAKTPAGELGVVGEQARDDQLPPGKRGEGLGDREQRVDLVLARRDDKHGSIGIQSHRAPPGARALDVKGGILAEDRTLEVAERRGVGSIPNSATRASRVRR